MEERVKKFKECIQDLNDEGVRSTYIYQYIADSLKLTEGEPTQIRRAKGFAYILEKVEQVVLPHELITGSMLGMCPVYGKKMTKEEQHDFAVQTIEEYLKKKKENQNFSEAIQFKEGHVKSFEDDFTSKKSRWSLMSRVHHDASIEFGDLQKQISSMIEKYEDHDDIEDYEIGRELERAFKIPYNQEDKDMYNGLPWFVGNHLNYNYEKVLKRGFGDIKKEIEERYDQAEDAEKKEYYQAAKITVDASIAFVKRYARTLEEKSQKEEAVRAKELKEMAEICKKIATEPAETFREAVQLTWMVHIIGNIQGGSALSFGRLDQYLNPYYEKDVEEGRITYEEAKTLVSFLWLKVNEPKMRTVQSVTLGGITPDGENAANEMTKVCLDTARDCGMPYPNVGLRVNPKNPEWVYQEALNTIKSGCGQPMLLNDEIWIPNTMKLGYSQELANDYYNMGCVEIMIPGKQPSWGVTDSIAFPVLLENVMEKWEKKELTLSTFDEFMDAYYVELDAAIEADRQEALDKQENMRGKTFDPYASMLIDGCLESGKDMLQGGSECPIHWSVYAYGIGTVADSLCAVKKFIYDEKKVTLEQMNDAINHDFQGYEDLQCMLDRMTPNYGNSNEEVDSIADEVLTHFSKQVLKLNETMDRDKLVSTLFGYFFHIYHGEIAKATPNGRHKGEAFSDSMGPSQGKDIEGPTRLLNSVIRLNNDQVTGGYALNFKISPAILNDESGNQATIDMLKTYIHHGGPQIQVYTSNIDDLKDAQIHPEKHRDLIVRVGGYCEFFVNLDRALQTEIIERTLYGEA